MRLFELERTNRGKLPKTAGDAVLKWDEDCKTPSRKDEVITLPAGHSVEMFSLLDGAQFLLDVDSRVFFGGTDERPFLVELDNRIMKHFGGDELQLFNALKPGPVKMLEKSFGVEAKRQGDWFAVPLLMSWDKVVAMLKFFSLFSEKYLRHNVKFSLGGTRHIFHGTGYWGLNVAWSAIGSGVLVAPDHEDLVLKEPHALFQTSYLANPKEAE